MTRLLNKTSKAYAVYALFTLTISIPAYYYLIDAIWLKDVDESLYFKRAKLEDQLNALPDSVLGTQIALINQLGIGLTMHPHPTALRKDSLYTIIRFDRYHGHKEPFRRLATQLTVRQGTYEVLLEEDLEETEALILPIVGIVTLFIALLLTGFILISRHLSIRIWQPFYATLDQLEHFTLNRPVPVQFADSDVYEFNQLQQMLRSLMERNLSLYQEQKEFTENASHELQTPLALLQTKIDILFQADSLTQVQADLLDESKQIIGRMSRLNKSLLLLSKIENKQFEPATPIHLSRLLGEMLLQYGELIEKKQLSLQPQIQTNVWVAANETLVEILFSNLLANAIRHNHSGGTLLITLTPDCFSLANSGTFQPLDAQKLFKRFQRSDSPTKGVGLGLAIVKEIANRYDWKLSYQFEKKRHIFSVRF